MKLAFTPAAWEDYLWVQEYDRKLLRRVNLLIKDTLRAPFEGIGKPEPLKANLTGCWSRRITDEHRLVYTATTTELTILSCRFHYEK